MKWALIILLVVLGFFFLLGVSAYGTYNRLIEKQEAVNAQIGQLQNVLQRRADLIPNLVNIVKGYAAHEKETLTAVIEARASATRPNIRLNASDPESLQRFIKAQDQFTSAISRLMLVSERYPDLKANEQFQRLMDELSGTENRISVERKRYNDRAREYNMAVRRFPGAIFANLFGFDPVPYFEASAEAQTAPKIEF